MPRRGPASPRFSRRRQTAGGSVADGGSDKGRQQLAEQTNTEPLGGTASPAPPSLARDLPRSSSIKVAAQVIRLNMCLHTYKKRQNNQTSY